MRYFRKSSTKSPALEFIPVSGPAQPYSFKSLNGWVERYACMLYGLGIRPGDRICLHLSNSPELIVSLFGNHLLGAISVPVNAATAKEELVYVAKKAEIAGLVSESHLPVPLRFHLMPSQFWSILREESRDFPENRDPEAAALLCFTSGTTSRPKGVLLNHRNIRSNLSDLIRVWQWTARDRLLLSLPLFHVHGLGVGLHGWALTGSSALVMEKFDAARVLDLLKERQCSLFMGVPTMYRRLVEVYDPRRHRFPGLRLAITGSAPMPVELHLLCRRLFGHTVLERYGMTESLMNTSNPFKGRRKPGSVGLPLPSVRIRLLDESRKEIQETGRPGEIHLRGPNVFAGYWKDPKATEQAFWQGWFRTGDVAYRDSEGYYYLVGRLAVDIIKSGGYRIGAREVEEVLERHPAVREAAVLGLSDPDLGERVTAFVVAASTVEKETLLAHCHQSLARYKCPRTLIFVPALPRNSMGKITKTELKSWPEGFPSSP